MLKILFILDLALENNLARLCKCKVAGRILLWGFASTLIEPPLCSNSNLTGGVSARHAPCLFRHGQPTATLTFFIGDLAREPN